MWVRDNKVWYEAELIELIRQVCEETIKSNNPDSGTNPYAAGRCITAENILDLIQENEGCMNQ